MLEGKITFDRFIRWVIIAVIAIGVIWLTGKLSSVLLPFFIGWFIAYLLYPIVKFVQYKLHVPSRALSIVVALIFVTLVVGLVIYLIIPPMIQQFERLGVVLMKYLNQNVAE